jgi:WD40 repeat protein
MLALLIFFLQFLRMSRFMKFSCIHKTRLLFMSLLSPFFHYLRRSSLLSLFGELLRFNQWYFFSTLNQNFIFSHSTSIDRAPTKIFLQSKFPFLWRDELEGKAKRAVKNQLMPLLLNSYKAHKNAITKLIYSDANQILISSCKDQSIRLWNLSGQVRRYFWQLIKHVWVFY